VIDVLIDLDRNLRLGLSYADGISISWITVFNDFAH